jgi:hypothetical protein
MSATNNLPKSAQAQAAYTDQFDADVTAASQPPDQPEPGQEQTPPPAPPQPQQPSADNTLTASLAASEARYKTLQGMYAAEQARNNKAIHDMATTIAELKLQVAKVNAQAQKPAEVPATTSKDAEMFGADLVEMVNRAAAAQVHQVKQEYEQQLAGQKAEIDALRGNVETVDKSQQQTREAQFYAALEREVPDFREVNATQEFQNWCLEVDKLSGLRKQDYLENAVKHANVGQLAALFNKFKETLAPPEPQPAKPQDNLRRQLSPSRTQGSPPPSTTGNPNEKVWSTNEIEKFYSDTAKGKWRGREPERAAMEAQIDAAVATGRVRA